MEQYDYGFRPDIITPDHYTLLGGQLLLEELQPDGQWDSFLPAYEPQNTGVETFNCTSFGTTNAIETLILRKLTILTNNSDRALGIIAGTGVNGNSPHVVAETVRKNGLIPEFRLPMFQASSIDKYYSPKPLPEDLVKIGKDWIDSFDFGHDWVFSTSDLVSEKIENKIKLMKAALKSSPLGISVNAWNKDEKGIYQKRGQDNHWCMCYGWTVDGWKVFDSYDNSHKIYSFDADILFAKRYTISKKKKVAPLPPISTGVKEFFSNLFQIIKKLLNL